MNADLRSCPSCRALVDEKESRCPYCDEDFGRPSVRRVEIGPSGSPGIVTRYIVGACVLFFILELIAALGAQGGQGAWAGLLNVPIETLFQMGGRSGIMISHGQWWRLVVPVFLHGGLLHLMFNGMALIQIGPLAEQAYGRSRFILIFVVSGILGNVLGIMLLDPRSVGIGASGALFGLIGAAGLYGHRRGDSFGLMIRRVMIQWGIYALVFGFLIGADNAAHIGGLVSGVALSFIVGDAETRSHPPGLWPSLAGIAVVVTVISFALAVYAYTLYGST